MWSSVSWRRGTGKGSRNVKNCTGLVNFFRALGGLPPPRGALWRVTAKLNEMGQCTHWDIRIRYLSVRGTIIPVCFLNLSGLRTWHRLCSVLEPKFQNFCPDWDPTSEATFRWPRGACIRCCNVCVARKGKIEVSTTFGSLVAAWILPQLLGRPGCRGNVVAPPTFRTFGNRRQYVIKLL